MTLNSCRGEPYGFKRQDVWWRVSLDKECTLFCNQNEEKMSSHEKKMFVSILTTRVRSFCDKRNFVLVFLIDESEKEHLSFPVTHLSTFYRTLTVFAILLWCLVSNTCFDDSSTEKMSRSVFIHRSRFVRYTWRCEERWTGFLEYMLSNQGNETGSLSICLSRGRCLFNEGEVIGV